MSPESPVWPQLSGFQESWGRKWYRGSLRKRKAQLDSRAMGVSGCPTALPPFQLPLCVSSSSSWLWSSGVHILQDREKGALAGLSHRTVSLWVASWPCVKATAPPHRSHPSWGEAGREVSLQSLPRSAVFCGSAQEAVFAEGAWQNRRCWWTQRRRSPSRWTLLPAPALSLARVLPYWPPYLSPQRLTKPFPIRHWQRAPRLPGVSH